MYHSLDPKKEEAKIQQLASIHLKEIKQVSTTNYKAGWSPAFIARKQKEDHDLKALRCTVTGTSSSDLRLLSEEGKLLKPFLHRIFVDASDILAITCDSPSGPVHLMLLPQELWAEAIQMAHETTAHQAAENTFRRLHQKCYFPRMRAAVDRFIQGCIACQQKDTKPKLQRHTYIPTLAGFPFEELSIDFVGPFVRSYEGNTHLFTVKCIFTKYIEAIPCDRQSAEAAIDALTNVIFPRFGFCNILKSDRGKQFLGNQFHNTARALGIELKFTPSYNPRSNPVERSHRTLGAMLKALAQDDPASWERKLPQALFAMRTSKNETTGFSPFFLLFGRDPNSKLDLLFPSPPDPESAFKNPAQYARDLQTRIRQAHAYARENIGRAIINTRRLYKSARVSFQPQDEVWLFTERSKPKVPRKQTIWWTGPWTVLHQVNDVVYRIKPHHSWKNQSTQDVAVDRLKMYSKNNEIPPREPEEDVSYSLLDGEDSCYQAPGSSSPPGPLVPPAVRVQLAPAVPPVVPPPIAPPAILVQPPTPTGSIPDETADLNRTEITEPSPADQDDDDSDLEIAEDPALAYRALYNHPDLPDSSRAFGVDPLAELTFDISPSGPNPANLASGSKDYDPSINAPRSPITK